jgi:uncharacterized protein
MTNTKVRDAFPDILRGFALFGIALVNIPLLSIDVLLSVEGTDLTQPSNFAAAFVVMTFFQAKFYIIFSFLFGYSAHYVIRGEKGNRRRWIGRSIGLVILGILHFMFFFHGDILFLYGLFGLLLLALYFRSDKTIKRWATGLYIGLTVVYLALGALTYVGEELLSSKGKSLPGETFSPRLNEALQSGSFLDTVGPRVELWLFAAPNGFLLQGPLVFIAFLVGVLVARKNGLVSTNPKLLNKLILWGFLVGLPVQALSAWLFLSNSIGADSIGIYLISLFINLLGAPILSAAYVALLWKIAQKAKLLLLSSAGRMSLTIYLGESIVAATIFSAWGFDLFAKLGVAEVTLIAAATWFGLALLSVLYFKVKNKGPMETVLTGFSRLFERKS